MALAMPRPFATKSGSYYLNVKVPLALRLLAKGQRVSLPVGDEHHSVLIGDKVVFSLRTKDAKVAKKRFPLALNALNAFLESLGQPPQTLGRADVRALAGEIYKQAVHEIDHDDAVTDEVAARRDTLADVTAQHRNEGASEKIACEESSPATATAAAPPPIVRLMSRLDLAMAARPFFQSIRQRAMRAICGHWALAQNWSLMGREAKVG